VVNSPALAPRPGAPSPLLRAQVPDAPDLGAFSLSGPASGERPRNSNRDSEDEDDDEDRGAEGRGLREELVRAHAGQNGAERGSSVEGQDGGGSDESDSDDGSYSPGVSDLTGSVDGSADGSGTSSEDGSYSPGVSDLSGSGESVSESEESEDAEDADDGSRGAGSGDADMASPGLDRSDEEIPSSEAGSLSGSEGGAAARGGARHAHAAAHGAGAGGTSNGSNDTPLPTFNLPSLSAVLPPPPSPPPKSGGGAPAPRAPHSPLTRRTALHSFCEPLRFLVTCAGHPPEGSLRSRPVEPLLTPEPQLAAPRGGARRRAAAPGGDTPAAAEGRRLKVAGSI